MSPVARSFPITIADVPAADRYELMVEGELAAVANYHLEADGAKIVLTCSELLPGFEGRGLGRQLAAAVLDDARRRGLVVRARCPFFSTFIEDHPEYRDLVEDAGRTDQPLADPIRTVAGG